MFMGGEFGQRREWNHDERLDWPILGDPLHRGLQAWVRDLNHIYPREPSLHQVDFEHAGFSWVDCEDRDNSVISFIRRAKNGDDFLLVVVNFTPVAREHYTVGVPEPGCTASS